MQEGGRRSQEEVSASNIEIISNTSRFYRRFHLEGRNIALRIQPPPVDQDPMAWLQTALNSIFHLVTADRDPTDYIGITLHSEFFRQGPVGLSFRPISNFSIEDLWHIVYSVIQSNTDFTINETLVVSAALVTLPAGSGKQSNILTHENVKKRSILQINNSDSLCLPRSLVTAVAHALRGQDRAGAFHDYWETIRCSRSVEQRERAQELVRDARVTMPENGCGLFEIQRFQNHLALDRIAIVVYNFQTFGRGGRPLFDGTDYVRNSFGNVQFTLNIMYYENARHYRPILNLVAASGCRKYCVPCNQGYNNYQGHRCTYKCPKCMQQPRCDETDNLMSCRKCARVFSGPECFRKHLTPGSYNKNSSVCQKVQMCKKCYMNVIIQGGKKGKHVCGVSYCNVCRKNRTFGHFCFMPPIVENLRFSDARDFLFVFFDFETIQSKSFETNEDVKLHEPNLCVAQQVCRNCLDQSEISEDCNFCGEREHIFYGEDVTERFIEYLLNKKEFKKVVVLSHYGGGFDCQFILKYLVEMRAYRIKPKIILTGSKIVLMTFENLKFLDTFNYFHLALSSLPKAYGLEGIAKGWFPHRFNLPENQNYVGPIPPADNFSPETMRPEERVKFLQWYDEKVAENYEFDFQREIIFYCQLDVKILRLASLLYRKTFLHCGNTCPFLECSTIASTCLRVFRKNFLRPETISILPRNGYRLGDTQSFKALQWLAWMERILGQNITCASRGREVRLKEGPRVDGFCRINGTAICLQFHGDYYHGCPKCFTINREKIMRDGRSMEDRFSQTQKISEKILSFGYRLIEIWECEFDVQIKENAEMRHFISSQDHLRLEPLEPRNAFFGGRTEACAKVISGKKMKYVDFRSLYPYICKRGKYPVGHPQVYYGVDCQKMTGSQNNDIAKIEGLIFCAVLPPRNLYHPVLPVRRDEKLVFPLCRSCCEEMFQYDCPHDNEEDRIIEGTWLSDELKTAVEFGYIVKKVYEIWHYKITQYDEATKTGGLFAQYVNQFFKFKTLASGYPADCNTEEERDRYVEKLSREEGIELRKEDIEDNPGKRSVSKLCLNSLWGKLAQRENQKTTEIVTEPERFFELLANPEVEVSSWLPVNDEVLYVGWTYRREAYTGGDMTNVVIALYTTAQARLKLLSILAPLGSRAIYQDTDSCIYICSEEPGQYEPPLGPLLGDLSDELSAYGSGSHIIEFVSGGPKFYAYAVQKSNGEIFYVLKVKGIRLNFENSALINFNSVKELVIRQAEGADSTITINPQVIRTTRFHGVVSRVESKICRPVYTKRRFLGLDRSYPFGFKT